MPLQPHPEPERRQSADPNGKPANVVASDAGPSGLGKDDEHALLVQRSAAHALSPLLYALILGWMKLNRHYRLAEPKKVRERFRKLVSEGQGPLLICSNHLTLIDSFIVIWALNSALGYFRRPSLFPWNLPERRNFWKNTFWRAICFSGKCIPVIRQGPREETQRVMNKLTYLLSRGDSIMIFPEGTRSRTGRIDVENCTYGVGQILEKVPEARVLCVYMRGRAQEKHSDFPKKGDTFSVDLDLIRPRSESTGLRGARDLANQIVQKLSAMENEYFARRQ